MATKPSDTYNLQDFISAGKSIKITHYNSSILQKIGEIEYPIYNVMYDYIDELNSTAVTVLLKDNEYNKYVYRPKILSYDVYGYTDFFFILMILNNICDEKDFTSKKIKILKPADLELVNRILNAEKKYIAANRSNL